MAPRTGSLYFLENNAISIRISEKNRVIDHAHCSCALVLRSRATLGKGLSCSATNPAHRLIIYCQFHGYPYKSVICFSATSPRADTAPQNCTHPLLVAFSRFFSSSSFLSEFQNRERLLTVLRSKNTSEGVYVVQLPPPRMANLLRIVRIVFTNLSEFQNREGY